MMIVFFNVTRKNMKKLIPLFLLFPLVVFAQKKIDYFDRDGDQFREEKKTSYIKNHRILKTITEIDSNKDGKVDKEITVFFHHDRLKAYKIIRTDVDNDQKWDKKEVKIEPITSVYSF